MVSLKSIWLKITYFYQFTLLNCSGCALCDFPNTQPICYDCLQLLGVISSSHHAIDSTLSNNLDMGYFIKRYLKPWRSMLIDYKYKQKINLKWALGYLLKLYIDKLGLELDYIIPVPIHYRKKQQRGFDHIFSLLGYYIASGGKIKVATRLVIKKVYHSSQVKLNREARINNLRNTFAITGSVIGKKILLIDDVYTTGATVNEIATELKNHGANKVYALVLLYNDIRLIK